MGYTWDSRAMMGSKDGGYSVDCWFEAWFNLFCVTNEWGDTRKKMVSLWVSKLWRFAIDEFLNVWQKKFWFHSIQSIVQVLKVPKNSCFFLLFFFLFCLLCCVFVWLICSSDFEFGWKMKCNEKIFRFFHIDWVHRWLWRLIGSFKHIQQQLNFPPVLSS